MRKKLSEILKATDGKLFFADKDLNITGICTDSRKVKKGDLFIALEGEKFDGHDFVSAAFENGAVAAVVAEKKVNAFKGTGRPLVAVKDTLTALADIARNHREQFDIPLVAVTGSNGKTTTKDLIATVLGKEFKILKNEGNFNNEIGVPLTLLKINPEIDLVVLEMAMRGSGQIRELCKIAKPQIGVLTNIAAVHYELLGSMENIADAKGELLEELPQDGLAVLNWEDSWCKRISSKFKGKIITYGFDKNTDIRAEDISHDGFSSYFTLCYQEEKIRVSLPLPGEHNILNALAAAAVGIFFELTLEKIAEGLRDAKISAMRLEFLEGPRGSKIINDSYNANPVSTKASLKILAGLKNGRKIAVLGDMLELGALEEEGHKEVGKEAASLKIDYLITVGTRARDIARGAVQHGMPSERVMHFSSTGEAANFLDSILTNGDNILVKGSRAMKMEDVIHKLESKKGE